MISQNKGGTAAHNHARRKHQKPKRVRIYQPSPTIDGIIKMLPAVVVILGYIAGRLPASRPLTFLYLLGIIACLIAIEVELYWVHKLHHSSDFELTRMLLLGSWLLFFFAGTIYTTATESTADLRFDYHAMIDPHEPFYTPFSVTNTGDTLRYVF